MGLPPTALKLLGRLLLGSEEPSLKALRLAKTQHTNSSPISNCQRSKLAIFLVTLYKLKYKFIVAVTCRNANYIYLYNIITYYISIYLSDKCYIPKVEMKTICGSP